MPEQIQSRDNPLVKNACKLAVSGAARAEQALFFGEGKKLCLDLAASKKAEALFCTQEVYSSMIDVEKYAEKVYIVSLPVAEKLSQTRTSQGLYGLFKMPETELASLQTEKGVLLAENMQDPANVGAVIRSAAAFGLGGVVFTAGSADYLSPKALRASMGCALRIPVIHGIGLSDAAEYLKKQGALLYAAALNDEALPLSGLKPDNKFVIMVGNEGAGLTEEALDLAGQSVYIPMHSGAESLNAAVAASVLMYDFKTKMIKPEL